MILAGSTCHTTTFPALVRTSNLMMQSSLEIKPFMSFPMDCSPAVGLFPNFNTSQAEAHYKGSKHAKKLKSMESSKSKQKSASTKDSIKAITNSATSTPVTVNCSDKPGEVVKITLSNSSSHNLTVVSYAERNGSKRGSTSRIANNALALKNINGEANSIFESEEEKARKLLYCSLCKVAVNSLSQLEAHNTGSKHKTMLEARNGAGPIKAYPRPGSKLKLLNGSRGSGLQNKTFHCEICDVHVNSEVQLKQHISSRRHKDRVAGKPMKPKYSPYNKHHRSPSILAAKMAFQKEMVKPLPPTFLSSPFGAAVSSQFSLQPRPSTPLFHTTTLSPALLRAGPGPIRASPAPILFAPY
ncbi:zinc finger protein 385B isoform X2 [Protopterus annectens]|uniref:zinc finger protein 385B isoform X2 n=1 Tax=Protopterus annectens TaxID=7888 RepID=UPI001CF9F112|nr:zinc finger protein 385B isoform X2 [Protopterus annectens]